ncbi:hypothetical protein A5658_27205 [Mycobacterium sp. 1245111.1]|uniref:Rv1419 family lectin n=1 Tax=Mycobacterium sp. 1245111.1 TaxID=1834073 RepID=UPI0007FEE3A5|nr:RICIN domain-containing protein [Mycobacterium sp. 1245111.1]OBK37845.1 hypothetical protein A5658_27205 [Mycobacterium sp. 1245111.1]
MLPTRVTRGARQALVVVGVGCAVAAPAIGEAAADGPVVLKSRLGDLCLDGPSDAWPTQVVVNACNGSDFQRWNVTGDQRLESVAFPGKCLTMPSETAFVSRLQPCWNSQRWIVQPDGRITTVFGPCLTVLGGPGPGTSVAARICTGGPEQGWDSVSQ